ncbi:hypothetical protein B0H15DRAFT_857858 [Mycena belliarum]|uniref:DNA polymerase n=1 Tax=Mycena belliarum TaxID=1033014 RepID=A0AAD6TYG2_9AGAR|nr:hypothetical protein B0H15DRAFT_857858 [Mycena belliae]
MLLARRRLALRLLRGHVRAYPGTEGPNHAILNMLKSNKEEEAQSANKNPYKIRAFTSAINVISQLDHPIQSAAEAKALKGVGPGIFRRIQEFFEASGLTPVVDPTVVDQLKRKRIACAELEKITGIGPVKAGELVAAGCMNLEQLRTPEYMAMLSPNQRIGVLYFRHFDRRVSRGEAETVAQFIRDALPSKYEIVIGGSYRRGAPSSSDIDLILLHPEHVHVPVPTGPPSKISNTPSRKRNGALPASLLQAEVVPSLQARGLLAAEISSGALKWQGIVLVPDSDADAPSTQMDQIAVRQRRLGAIERGEGAYRRMDLNLVAQKSRGAALLALTGDTEFNRDLRIRASRLGMHLNEFGLWRWNEKTDEDSEEEYKFRAMVRGEIEPEEVPEAPDDECGFWELVHGETEEELMRELGMDYVEPIKRNFALVLGKGPLRGRR